MKKYADWRKRIVVVAFGWAGATIFFSALLAVSEPGSHKPLDFVLYVNAMHYAIWALSLPPLAECVQRFPFSQGDQLRHGAALLLAGAGLTTLVWFMWQTIIFSTWFPYRASFPTLTSVLTSEFGRSSFRADVFICLGL